MTKTSKRRPRAAKARAIPSLPQLNPDQRYTVDEATQYLRIGRGRFYERVRRGEINVQKDGTRTLLGGRELQRLTAGA